ncbi:MAG: right-handed parallel beta-helix repeat-containing protein, partial [bacterium]|nr:right-handed parallel beta-helix repeat-containing protein [bacterium]
MENPFKTINRAMQQALQHSPSDRIEIRVIQGTYNECVVYQRNAVILGGYNRIQDVNSGTTIVERDIERYQTTINSHGISPYAILATTPVNEGMIDGFTVTSWGQGYIPGQPSYPAIYVLYATGFTITNNIVECNGGNHGIAVARSTNVLVANNIVRTSRVGIFFTSALSDGSNPMLYPTSGYIYNNTVINNTGYGQYVGTGIYIGRNVQNTDIQNNIVAFNSYGIMSIGEQYNVTLDYNDVYGNTIGNYYGVNPGPKDNSVDPLFVDSGNLDYHLQAVSDGFPVDSPCIDRGNDASSFYDTDFPPGKGGNRNDQGYTGGWYAWVPNPEYPERRIIYVDANNGSDVTGAGSRRNPYQSIRKALNSVVGSPVVELPDNTLEAQYQYRIYVAVGTYNENITLEPFEFIQGGFDPSTWARDLLNPNSPKTIINGTITASNQSWIDGCTINGSIICDDTGPDIANNVISNPAGTAIGCRSAAFPKIWNNVIKNSAVGIS